MPRKPPETHRRVLLEVCVESVDDAVAAAAGGADRIELNSALSLDGLTPSPGLLLEARRAVRVPLIAMARPRAGDFEYSESEFRVLRRDANYAVEHGADGVAFGILTGRRIDTRRCRTIARLVNAAGKQAVFHRAFDAVADPFIALEQLVDLGVRRVMTSGGQRTALAGAATIARLIERAAGRIDILPAGGIRPSNVLKVLARTRCDQVHTSLRAKVADSSLDPRLLAAIVRRIGRG